MLLEYSYDNMNKVIDLFNNSKIAKLNITRLQKNTNKYVIDYILFENITNPVDKEKAEALIAKSFSERLQTTTLLNDFLEHMMFNKVTEFYLYFNVLNVFKCECSFSHVFSPLDASMNNKSKIMQFYNYLDLFDKLCTDMGIHKQTVPDVYKRMGKGRGTKNIPLTIKDICDIMRHSLSE